MVSRIVPPASFPQGNKADRPGLGNAHQYQRLGGRGPHAAGDLQAARPARWRPWRRANALQDNQYDLKNIAVAAAYSIAGPA
jgi:hypothetical protein